MEFIPLKRERERKKNKPIFTITSLQHFTLKIAKKFSWENEKTKGLALSIKSNQMNLVTEF